MGREGGGFSGGGGFSSGGFGGGGRSSGGFRGGSPRAGSYPGGNYDGGYSGGSGGGSLFGGYLLWRLLDGARRAPSGGSNSSGSGGNNNGSNNNGGGGNFGCLTAVAVLVAAVLLVGLLSFVMDAPGCSETGGSSITASTVEREALPANAVIETGYYQDADGQWIQNASQLESGMRQFYKATGVQPFLYVAADKSMDASQCEQFATQQYPKLFSDQGHFLFVFCYQGRIGGVHSYTYGCYFGSQAKTVMDTEAEEIFLDYLDRYINDESISESQAFSEAYSKTAERIMTTDAQRATPAIIGVAVSIAVIVVVIVIAVIFIRRSKQREREQKRQQEILNTPLEKFGDTELDELEKKYSDAEDAIAPPNEGQRVEVAEGAEAIQEDTAPMEGASIDEGAPGRQ